MTTILVTIIGLLAVYAVYIAAMLARIERPPQAFLDGGNNIPGWAFAFCAAGVVLVGSGLANHLALVSRFGLQANHIGVGMIIAALTAVLVQKRFWLAARIAGLRSPGMALGCYYQSTALRIVAMGLTALFALPYAAHLLGGVGDVVEAATGGGVPRTPAIWLFAFILFLPAVIGGWRAVVLVAALQSAVVVVGLIFILGFGEGVLASGGFLSSSIPVADGILADRLPGVVQYSAGIGKEVAAGGIFTGVAVVSMALTLVGLVLSPTFLYLGMTVRPGQGFAVTQVWMIAGLVGAVLVLAAPFLAARLDHGITSLAGDLARVELLAGTAAVLVFVVAAQLAVSFFVTGGTLQLARELLFHDILPGLSPRGERFAVRITLAVAFGLVAILAAFAPVASAIFASTALPLSAQMLPAALGLAYLPWVSRSAVLAGLIVGGLLVVFTEPLGLVLFEGLFLELPWGRWPLTVHSAAWGLVFNVAVVLLVSIFTRKGAERQVRDRLHAEFRASWSVPFGGKSSRTAKWSLTLIWAFFALGPGAILGNTFFSEPVFADGAAALGIPSLWVWQIFFWLIGIPLVWWLAYFTRLGITAEQGVRRVVLINDDRQRIGGRTPGWIAAGLSRLTDR